MKRRQGGKEEQGEEKHIKYICRRRYCSPNWFFIVPIKIAEANQCTIGKRWDFQVPGRREGDKREEEADGGVEETTDM